MRTNLLAWMAGASLLVGGCSGGGGQGSGQPASPQDPGADNALRISGSPPAAVLIGEQYEFRPATSGANGHALMFEISRKPAWASFSKATGRLSGTPEPGDVGTYADVRIKVSNGDASASLTAFSITVSETAPGAVTLSWMPPTRNNDGSTLTDLKGYRIYVGRRPEALSRVIILNNPGLTRYVVEALPPATWHFAMTSVNARGRESKRSATVRKRIG